jgi:magnesium chelatase subunit I
MESDAETLKELRSVKGLLEAARGRRTSAAGDGEAIAAAELILEGLHAAKKIARSEARGVASYSQAKPERPARSSLAYDDWSGGKVN